MENDHNFNGANVAFQLGVLTIIAAGVAAGDSPEKIRKDVNRFTWNMLKLCFKLLAGCACLVVLFLKLVQ